MVYMCYMAYNFFRLAGILQGIVGRVRDGTASSANAEANAEDDKKKKELVETRNQADALVYQTEKSIKELGDKVDETTRSQVETASAALKKALEGDDTDEIRRLSEELTQVSHKLAEAMYKQASQNGEAQGGPGSEDAAPGDSDAAGAAAGGDEDVVDADFEEVKEDKK